MAYHPQYPPAYPAGPNPYLQQPQAYAGGQPFQPNLQGVYPNQNYPYGKAHSGPQSNQIHQTPYPSPIYPSPDYGMQYAGQQFPTRHPGHQYPPHIPHQQSPMGYGGPATPTYGYQNYQHPMTPIQTPNSAQFPYPSPQFPPQQPYGYSHAPPINQYPIQHHPLPTPATNVPPALPEWSQLKTKDSTPFPVKNNEVEKQFFVKDTENWETEFPGVQFPGTINKRRKPQYGSLIDLTDFDKSAFDFNGPMFFSPGEKPDERFSIGQSILYLASSVRHPLPATYEESENDKSWRTPALGPGLIVSKYCTPIEAAENLSNVRERKEWKTIRHDPIFAVFPISKPELIHVNDIKLALSKAPDSRSASPDVMEGLEEALMKQSEPSHIDCAIEKKIREIENESRENAPILSEQERMLAALGVEGPPKPVKLITRQPTLPSYQPQKRLAHATNPSILKSNPFVSNTPPEESDSSESAFNGPIQGIRDLTSRQSTGSPNSTHTAVCGGIDTIKEDYNNPSPPESASKTSSQAASPKPMNPRKRSRTDDEIPSDFKLRQANGDTSISKRRASARKAEDGVPSDTKLRLGVDDKPKIKHRTSSQKVNDVYAARRW